MKETLLTVLENTRLADVWEEVDKINKTAPLYRRIRKLILRKKEFIKNTSNKLVRFAEENKVE